MLEPKFDDYMKPILDVMKDSGLRRNPEIKALVLSYMKLKKEDFKETQKNGNMKYSDNINFAISYLFMAGLLDRKARGTYQITQEGLRVINDPTIKEINEKFLRDTPCHRCGGTVLDIITFFGICKRFRVYRYDALYQTLHVV